MLDLALVGFRYGNNLKCFKVDQGNTSPENLGNKFASSLAVSSSFLVKDDYSEMFFYNIFLSEDKSDNYIVRRFLPANKEKIANMDFGFIRFSVSRGRSANSSVIIPDNAGEMKPENLQKYRWAYIYNFKDKRLEFYGKDYPIKEPLESIIDVPPYFASININFLTIISGFQKNYNVIQFLPRNHDQEIILKKSMNEAKPHKHKEGRKKPIKRSYY